MPLHKAKVLDASSSKEFSLKIEERVDSSPRVVPVTPQRLASRKPAHKDSAINEYQENNRQLALKNAQLLANLKRLNKLAVKLWVQHVADRMKLESHRQKEKASEIQALRSIQEHVVLLLKCHSTLTKILSALKDRISDYQLKDEKEWNMHCPSDLLANNDLEDLLKKLQKMLFCTSSDSPDMTKLALLKETTLDFNNTSQSCLQKASLFPTLYEE